MELVDTHALGACASRREGSSPFIRTITLYIYIYMDFFRNCRLQYGDFLIVMKILLTIPKRLCYNHAKENNNARHLN